MINPANVHDTLRKYQLVDGYGIVLDLDKSHGSWIHDSVTGDEFLDAFTCFASWPLGYNHPHLCSESSRKALGHAALSKPSNSDVYTVEMAEFVKAFGDNLTPDQYPYHFWVSGGALAVENAMKTAFDWKARKLGRTQFSDSVNDLVMLHFERAFHGRSGYTLSVTNTIPDKVGLFPQFDWPRVPAPGIEFDNAGGIANDVEALEAKTYAAIDAAFKKYGNKVAGILIEPMQGEGGDRHFRPEFFARLRKYADDNEALLIFDEVQTGFYGTGKPWMWQHIGVEPDVVSFGKKAQVCGIYASKRLDEVPDHVFAKSSRINSTWGGNLVDMVRSRLFIEVINADGLADHTTKIGDHVVKGLRSISQETGAFKSVRGIGSLIAFSFENSDARDAMVNALYEKRVMALGCGDNSVRFRLPLIMTQDEADELLNRLSSCIPAVVG